MNLGLTNGLSSADLIFFLVLASARTQAAAARSLGVSATAVGKHLDALERKAGVRLVLRRSRGFELTEEGQLLKSVATRIQFELEELADAFAARQNEATGELSIAVSSGFGRRYVAPSLADFKLRHPRVRARLVLTDQSWRALAEPFDIVIHIGHLTDSSWIATKLAENRRILCAAPSYIEQFGSPGTPSELAQHRCLVVHEYAEDAHMWTLHEGEKRDHHVRIRPWLSTNDGDVLREWGLAGLGIMQRSEWDAAEHLAAGRLKAVLPDYSLPEAPVIALTPSRRLLPARVRLYLEFLKKGIGSPPIWNRRYKRKP
jgi:DNA-binding transcriptional LysR family regulator